MMTIEDYALDVDKTIEDSKDSIIVGKYKDKITTFLKESLF